MVWGVVVWVKVSSVVCNFIEVAGYSLPVLPYRLGDLPRFGDVEAMVVLVANHLKFDFFPVH